MKQPKLCLTCGKPATIYVFKGRRHFCSSRCWDMDDQKREAEDKR